jgi:hypothetical protein
MHQNKQISLIAAGVRLHQCHITCLARIRRNCHSGMFLKLQCQALTCRSPPVAQLQLAHWGHCLKGKQTATIVAGVRLHQCHITYLEPIKRNCHSGIFVKLQCKAMTCTAPHVAQYQLAHRGHCLKTSKWQQLQQARDCTSVIQHIQKGLSECAIQECFLSCNAKH